MPKRRFVGLNNNAGAFVAVLSTRSTRRLTVREDEQAAGVGLQYKLPDDSFVQIYGVAAPGTPDSPQVDLWDQAAAGRGSGQLLGLPQQGSSGDPGFRAADTYIQLRSNAAGTTNVRVVEHD